MEPQQAITMEFDVPATMRDGTVLRANVVRPSGEGRWPVLLWRTPYGKDAPEAYSVAPTTALPNGRRRPCNPPP
jgi:predicted acyl esterase